MAEEASKITTVKKVKDPRSVEQGKRLAAISREAKKCKAREREQRCRGNFDGQQETNERRTRGHEFRAEHLEVISGSWRRIPYRKVPSEKRLRPGRNF